MYCGESVVAHKDGRAANQNTRHGWDGEFTGFIDCAGSFVHFRRFCADKTNARYKKPVLPVVETTAEMENPFLLCIACGKAIPEDKKKYVGGGYVHVTAECLFNYHIR